MSSSSSSSSSSSPFSFPALNVSDDSKESYPPSLFSSSQPNYRTIEALPSPSSSTPSPFSTEQVLYRSTASVAALEDEASDAWGSDQAASFAHKELTLGHIREAGELPGKVELPEVQVVGGWSGEADVPMLPALLEGQYSLAASQPCHVVMAAFPACLDNFRLRVSYEVHPSKPRLSGVFYDETHSPVHFQLNVFKAEEGPAGSTVVEIQRRAGDLRSFHSFFLALEQFLTEAGILRSDLHQSHYPMESMDPPPFDSEGDDALDLLVQDLYKAKALSINHSDAREGLQGLLCSAPLPLVDVCPLMQKAMGSGHDVEQQRLAFALFQQSMECTSPSGAALAKPVLPGLFDCMGDLSPSYASIDAARSLVRICDSLEGNSQLAGMVDEHAELVAQVRQVAGMVKA